MQNNKQDGDLIVEKLKPIPLGIAAGVVLGAGILITNVWNDLSTPYLTLFNLSWGVRIGNAIICAVAAGIGGYVVAVLYNYLYDK